MMKKGWLIKGIFLLVATLFVLSACSDDNAGKDSAYTLKNQAGEEVKIPNEKPVLLFFFTTYT